MTVRATYAAPHHLVADGPVLGLRRTRSGDAWALRQGLPVVDAAGPAVGLGMPTIGAPAPLPDAPVCR